MAKTKLNELTTGIPQLADACVVLVTTEWNAPVVQQLERGCIAVLEKHNVKQIEIITVPGAVEIPFGIKRLWEKRSKKDRPDVFIALGCVIRGGTPHFEFVCRAVTDGITQLNLSLPVPVIFGVLTVDNEEQALERAGGIHGNKGEEAALTALKMVGLNSLL